MKSKLDLEKVNAAFEQAAVLSTNRDSQRGEFRAQIGLQDLALRMRNEIDVAILNWATVETFNNRFEEFETTLTAIKSWNPAKFAIKALVRDVIAALMRVTDSPGSQNDLETLCRFVDLLTNLDANDIAKSTGANEHIAHDALTYLRARVPRTWGKKQNEICDHELLNLRNVFKPIRDTLIAHSASYSSIDLQADIPKIRHFLLVVTRLCHAACLLCNIDTDDYEVKRNVAMEQATAFWDAVLMGSERSASSRVPLP
jgi:hypothetical protein